MNKSFVKFLTRFFLIIFLGVFGAIFLGKFLDTTSQAPSTSTVGEDITAL